MEITNSDGKITYESYKHAVRFGSYPRSTKLCIEPYIDDNIIPLYVESDLTFTSYKESYEICPIQECVVVTVGPCHLNWYSAELTQFSFLINRTQFLYMLKKMKFETSNSATGVVRWIKDSTDRKYLIENSIRHELEFEEIFFEFSKEDDEVFISLMIHFKEENLDLKCVGVYTLYTFNLTKSNDTYLYEDEVYLYDKLIDLFELNWEGESNRFKNDVV